MKTPEEIKKELERCKEGAHCNACSSAYHCQIEEDALTYIQQLEAQVPKWISVDERLPERGRYLVITKKGDGMTKVNTATYNDMGWWTYANFGEITHWMPLPEPPKEG